MNLRIVGRVGSSLVSHIQAENWSLVYTILTKAVLKFRNILFLPLGLLIVLGLRAVRPWFLVRIDILISERLGHFATNTELYLCERDAGINTPEKRHIDLWYHNWPVSNRQLARMWGRVLHIWPSWLLAPVRKMNALIPGGEAHRIGENTQIDRDVHNLLDRFPAHLSFLPEEEERGEAGLRGLGIPVGAPFVCLNVRDGSYLNNSIPWKSWNYHNYRDCNIRNYVLAAQKLAERGYYIVRVGAVVQEAMNVAHPMIIDYAANGMRSDFMDIYLGAKCAFCISTSSGFDAVPHIFRRPIVFIDQVPSGILATFSSKEMVITRGHWLRNEKRFMTFREIFESGAGHFLYSKNYENMGIDLIESSPEMIAATVLEMESRVRGAWQGTEEDEALQRRFWEIFPKPLANYNSRPLHGEIQSRIGADFLRQHKDWLE